MGTEPAVASAHAGRLEALFDLSRGRQATLSIAQPALGAVMALGQLPTLRTVALGLVAAGAGYFAVFSLNDLLDRRADREAAEAGGESAEGYDLDVAFVRHPLVRGDLSDRAAATWIAVLAAVSVVAAWLLAPICLAFFALAVVLEVGYCALRSVTWTKTFVSGLMVAVGGLAGWVAVAPVDSRAIALFAFLALWEITGRNLPNDLADLRVDRGTDIRTVATVFGPRASGVATMAGSVAATGSVLALPVPAVVRAVSVVLAVMTMLVPATGLARRPTPERAAAYFNRASALPLWLFLAYLAALVVGR